MRIPLCVWGRKYTFFSDSNTLGTYFDGGDDLNKSEQRKKDVSATHSYKVYFYQEEKGNQECFLYLDHDLATREYVATILWTDKSYGQSKPSIKIFKNDQRDYLVLAEAEDWIRSNLLKTPQRLLVSE